MFHLRFGLSDHLKTLPDFVFGSRRRVKKVRIFRAWFSQRSQYTLVALKDKCLKQTCRINTVFCHGDKCQVSRTHHTLDRLVSACERVKQHLNVCALQNLSTSVRACGYVKQNLSTPVSACDYLYGFCALGLVTGT